MKQNMNSNTVSAQKQFDASVLNGSSSVHFASYHEMADVTVTFKSLEEEFISRLALVEDLHKRFHFMMTELKSAGLRTDE